MPYKKYFMLCIPPGCSIKYSIYFQLIGRRNAEKHNALLRTGWWTRHHVIPSFLRAFMPHQVRTEIGQKAQMSSQNATLSVLTMAYSLKEWKWSSDNNISWEIFLLSLSWGLQQLTLEHLNTTCILKVPVWYSINMQLTLTNMLILRAIIIQQVWNAFLFVCCPNIWQSTGDKFLHRWKPICHRANPSQHLFVCTINRQHDSKIS